MTKYYLSHTILDKLNSYDWLYCEHVVKRRTLKNIAIELGISPPTVRNYVKKIGVPIQKRTFTLDHIRKITEANREKAKDPKFLEKLSLAVKQSWQDPHIREKHSLSINAVRKTDEYKKMQSVAIKNWWDNYAPTWRKNIKREYSYEFDEQFKEYIRNKFNRRCFLCNKHESKNSVDPRYGTIRKSNVHHIYYDKSIHCYEEEWKFVVLCESCHIKTNFKKWYWFNLLVNYWAMNPDICFF